MPPSLPNAGGDGAELVSMSSSGPPPAQRFACKAPDGPMQHQAQSPDGGHPAPANREDTMQ